jgi:hypothetical protein
MITKTILIATLLAPKAENWDEFKTVLGFHAAEMHVTAGRIGVTDGPGCCNLSIEVTGPEKDIEHFGNSLCMAMMPSRWSFTSDEPIDTYNLKSR